MGEISVTPLLVLVLVSLVTIASSEVIEPLNLPPHHHEGVEVEYSSSSGENGDLLYDHQLFHNGEEIVYSQENEGVMELDHIFNSRSPRAMYLAQGVEFVFPIGVQYTLANVNEQLWPVGTEGFEGVLEFPKNKIAVMFSSMINTLRIANFTVTSTIYSPEKKSVTTPLRILGTDVKTADFRAGYKETWTQINEGVKEATGRSIPEFVPKGGLYGRTIYPFSTAALVNTIHYENRWAFPWKEMEEPRKFTDSDKVKYIEVEGLMPYYENDVFVAVAALFKSGTGSVVFLKPKGSVSILQLMLNPTALTQIFDENFPGWGVKNMKLRVPQASFTTNSQHFDMLQKRGVTSTFCTHETASKAQPQIPTRFTLNPIVQTNHVRISKDIFTISSVTGVTINNETELNSWTAKQLERDDLAPETLLEEYTTPQASLELEEGDLTTLASQNDEVGTTEGPASLPRQERSETEEKEGSNSNSTSTSETPPQESPETRKEKEEEIYDFNEPFLWFLHAINEEPMFMGVVESFKRYLEETGNKDNLLGEDGNAPIPTVVEKNKWIYEAARGVLWHCPSTISRQAEK